MRNTNKVLSAGITYITGACLFFVFAFQSCYKDAFDTSKMTKSEINSEWALPVIHSKFTLKKILEDGKVQYKESADHFVSLLYSDLVYSQTAQEMINIPNQSIDTIIRMSYPVNLPQGDSVIENFTYTAKVKTDHGEILDSVLLKEAWINIIYVGNMNHDGRLNITIPALTLDGVPFKASVPYNYQSSVPVMVKKALNVSGYKLVPTKPFPGETQIKAYFSLTGYEDGNQNISPYTFSIHVGIDDIKFSKVYGYLGQHTANLNQSQVSVNIFDDVVSGSFEFQDPRINIYFANSFGMPLGITYENLYAVNEPTTVNITGPGLNGNTVNYPTFSQIGQTVVSTHVLDKNNSNVNTALNISPRKIGYKIKGTSNPTATLVPNFVLDTSRMITTVEVELPLFGRAWNFLWTDSMDFEFEDVEGIQSLQFIATATNFLPLDVHFQVIFADSNNTALDSLFVPYQAIIKSAPAGQPPTYKSTTPTKKVTTTTLTKQQVDKILKTKKVFLRAFTQTSDLGQTIVKLYSDQFFDLHLGVKVHYKNKF